MNEQSRFQIYDMIEDQTRKLTKKKLLEYLQENHPYPEDIFQDNNGKASRVGYNSCIYNIKKFFKELKEK